MSWLFRSRKTKDEGAGPIPTKDAVEAITRRRRYLPGVPYIFPRDEEEQRNLDFQHHVLRVVMKRNYLVPLVRPTNILDVGCGTGQWAYDICAEFPDALVVGLDLEKTKQPTPPNFSFILGNILEGGLPFADNQFDYVHQRLLAGGIPLRSWQPLLHELVRVTRPGGWVELAEATYDSTAAGPMTRRLLDAWGRLASTRGLDSSGMIANSLEATLGETGVDVIDRKTFSVPIRRRAGRIGELMEDNFLHMFNSLSDLLHQYCDLTDEDLQKMLVAMQKELEHHHIHYQFRVVCAQKPLLSAKS